jgi:carbonic anhydrase
MNTLKRNAVRILTCSYLAFSASIMAGESTNVGADEALNRLLSGDKRFVAGKSNEPTGPALVERRHALSKEQKPFAVVVGCSDSRVPPELVFDASLGDILSFAPLGK